MKYNDNWKHKKKLDENELFMESNRKRKREEIRKINNFLPKVPDKIWFKSLTLESKSNVFLEYHRELFRLGSDNDKSIDFIWEKLKMKYQPDKIILRDLKIDEILK